MHSLQKLGCVFILGLYVVNIATYIIAQQAMIFRFCYPCPTTCSIQAQRIHVFSYLHRWYLQCYDDHPTTTFPSLSFSINGDSLRIQQAQGANVRSMSILFSSHRIISSHSQHITLETLFDHLLLLAVLEVHLRRSIGYQRLRNW